MFYRNSGPDFLEDEELQHRYKLNHASVLFFFPYCLIRFRYGLKWFNEVKS